MMVDQQGRMATERWVSRVGATDLQTGTAERAPIPPIDFRIQQLEILSGHGDVATDTPAHIDSMTETGNTDTPGGTEYDIALTITPAGGPPYDVTINQYIYPSNPFSAGEDVTVKIDPDDQNVAMIFGHA